MALIISFHEFAASDTLIYLINICLGIKFTPCQKGTKLLPLLARIFAMDLLAVDSTVLLQWIIQTRYVCAKNIIVGWIMSNITDSY